ncbi:hypothetical protein TTHERM_00165010 (macronuclear) [Tetrahymena thermophila SB210]|uniref:Uncharacterized protein n=1 Tax=Tetrahymena thermophila (strain SB210) TaxID=312017 RepID=X1W3P3_TETTS|nr:hypothetical protein TTHERM_00165010 [Tetrahymena thermophila SB210]EAR88411.2 hypothetical protein TTHERM_00165010 [Tetrahymena thermophila SB210]|eukprot:XP_001008656.2 hypothetical protein TTHERM_00165010 [Tetrahymena thermophila SB210]
MLIINNKHQIIKLDRTLSKNIFEADIIAPHLNFSIKTKNRINEKLQIKNKVRAYPDVYKILNERPKSQYYKVQYQFSFQLIRVSKGFKKSSFQNVNQSIIYLNKTFYLIQRQTKKIILPTTVFKVEYICQGTALSTKVRQIILKQVNPNAAKPKLDEENKAQIKLRKKVAPNATIKVIQIYEFHCSIYRLVKIFDWQSKQVQTQSKLKYEQFSIQQQLFPITVYPIQVQSLHELSKNRYFYGGHIRQLVKEGPLHVQHDQSQTIQLLPLFNQKYVEHPGIILQSYQTVVYQNVSYEQLQNIVLQPKPYFLINKSPTFKFLKIKNILD